MHIQPFKGVIPKLNQITAIGSFFNTVKEDFPKYAQAGFFQEPAPASLYIYQIQSSLHQHIGLIACANVQDYLSGKIKKHEHTLPEKEERQFQLLSNRNAIVKPVLLAYPNIKAIDDWMQQYVIEHAAYFKVHFPKEDQYHFLWQINKRDHIRKLQELFEKEVPYSYIADGHHRSAVAAKYFQRKDEEVVTSDQKFLCAFFSFSEIDILDFNRIIQGFAGYSASALLDKLTSLFSIRPLLKAQKPEHKHQLSMYLDKQWYLLDWKPEVLSANPSKGIPLDAELLNEKVLRNILDIKEVRTNPRIRYIRGPKGLDNIGTQTDKLKEGIAFCLFPIQLRDLVAKANAKEILPPKSTWVEPRMKNGLIVQELY